MTFGVVVLLLFAGLAAGVSGTLTGLGSVFSYPALLAAGIPPTAANVTNTVSLAFGTVAAVPSSRRELAGQGAAVREFGLVCALGSALGACLLLVTPPGAFERVVPFLVAAASLLILRRRRTEHAAKARRWPAMLGVFAVAVYGGYFAAAAGVLILGLLLATMTDSLVRLNALKNVLTLIADVIAALAFGLFGQVSWVAVVPLTLGLLVGSWLGPALARRIPAGPLRIGIAVAGLALAVKLAVDAFA